MSYEQQIKLKHAIEDSFKELLSFTSALSDRELEIAAARAADSVSKKEQGSVDENTLLVGRVLQMLIHFRQHGQMKQSKSKRLWFSMKKSSFRREIAEAHMTKIVEKHSKLCAEHKKAQEKRQEAYEREYAAVKKQRAEMPFFKRLFKGPRLPLQPYYEPRPILPSLHIVEARVSSHLEIDELLIRKIVGLKFPHIKAANDFATEENLRSLEVKLLAK